MSDVKLMLHTGATLVSEEELEHLREPTGSTETHIKLGHPEYLDMVKGELDKRQIGHRKGEFAITPSNECMFGLIPLEEFSIPSIDLETSCTWIPHSQPRTGIPCSSGCARRKLCHHHKCWT